MQKHAVEHVKSFETWKSDAAHRYIGSTFNKRNMDQFSDDLVDGYLHDLGHATFRQHFVDLGLSEAVTAVSTAKNCTFSYANDRENKMNTV